MAQDYRAGKSAQNGYDSDGSRQRRILRTEGARHRRTPTLTVKLRQAQNSTIELDLSSSLNKPSHNRTIDGYFDVRMRCIFVHGRAET